MDRSALRVFSQLQYIDPKSFLVELRQLEIEVALSKLDDRTRALRPNSLKQTREQRQAAVFCVGMSQRIGHPVYFAAHENQDFDFVAKWIIDDQYHFATVQLKEIVPKALNAQADINLIIESLDKYTDSAELTIAIHLNQSGRFEPKDLDLRHLNVSSVWVFAGTTLDQSRWNLWGNFTEENPYGTQFEYPTEA